MGVAGMVLCLIVGILESIAVGMDFKGTGGLLGTLGGGSRGSLFLSWFMLLGAAGMVCGWVAC